MMPIIRALEQTREETLKYFSLGEHDLVRTYDPGKWSVRFVLHHLADSETVIFERVRRALSEPRPVVWVMDQDAWAKGLDYAQIPLDIARGVYESARNAIIYYAGRYYDSKGMLEFVHSVDGVRTLKDEFDKAASHNENHLAQIRRALTLAFLTLLFAAGPAGGQRLTPTFATAAMPTFAARWTLEPDSQPHVKLPPTYWLEGGLIGGLLVGSLGGALGEGFCGYDDQPGSNCLAQTLEGVLIGATLGFSVGALIGGQFPKRRDELGPSPP